MKIVYLVKSLSSCGGVEIVTATKASGLADITDCSVWIVTCSDDSCSSVVPLSDKVHLIGIRNRNILPFPWNLTRIIPDLLYLRKSLRNILNGIDPDIVISTGSIEKWVVPIIHGRWSTIREIHNTKYYRRKDARSFPAKVFARLTEFIDYTFIDKRFDRIVLLTEEDKSSNWKGSCNTCVIPNPVRFKSDTAAALDNKRIISVGRLSYQKNYPSLLSAIRTVFLRYPEWKLDILGEGEERPMLESLVEHYSLQDNVYLRGYQENVRDWMMDSSMFVMTSRFEGFPLVMVEAMSCGLPVVTYSYPCGPKDIITNDSDGFLVPEGDERSLAERICQLIEDDQGRKRMGGKAFISSKKYDIPNIVHLWMDLFQTLK